MEDRHDPKVFWIVMVVLLLLSRIPAMATYLSIDNVNLAFSLHKFDPRVHQPQPPGYPFFVSASHPTQPEQVTGDPAGIFKLAATAADGKASGRARIRALTPSAHAGTVRAALAQTTEAVTVLAAAGRQPYHDLPDIAELLEAVLKRQERAWRA